VFTHSNYSLFYINCTLWCKKEKVLWKKNKVCRDSNWRPCLLRFLDKNSTPTVYMVHFLGKTNFLIDFLSQTLEKRIISLYSVPLDMQTYRYNEFRRNRLLSRRVLPL